MNAARRLTPRGLITVGGMRHSKLSIDHCEAQPRARAATEFRPWIGMRERRVVHPVVCRWRLLVGIQDLQPRPCDLNGDPFSHAHSGPGWVQGDREIFEGEWHGVAAYGVCVYYAQIRLRFRRNASHSGLVTSHSLNIPGKRSCKTKLRKRNAYARNVTLLWKSFRVRHL